MITPEGGKLRMLTISDEFTHECLAIGVSRRLKSIDVIAALADLFMRRGVARHIRPDHGPAFMAKAVQDWLAAVGASTAYIARGSPWQNGFIERFNARRRDQLLAGAIFSSLRAAQIVIDSWRRHDHGVRPHASIGDQAPAPEGVVPARAAWPAAPPRPAPPAMLPLAPRPTLN
jgi:putative transposase